MRDVSTDFPEYDFLLFKSARLVHQHVEAFLPMRVDDYFGFKDKLKTSQAQPSDETILEYAKKFNEYIGGGVHNFNQFVMFLEDCVELKEGYDSGVLKLKEANPEIRAAENSLESYRRKYENFRESISSSFEPPRNLIKDLHDFDDLLSQVVFLMDYRWRVKALSDKGSVVKIDPTRPVGESLYKIFDNKKDVIDTYYSVKKSGVLKDKILDTFSEIPRLCNDLSVYESFFTNCSLDDISGLIKAKRRIDESVMALNEARVKQREGIRKKNSFYNSLISQMKLFDEAVEDSRVLFLDYIPKQDLGYLININDFGGRSIGRIDIDYEPMEILNTLPQNYKRCLEISFDPPVNYSVNLAFQYQDGVLNIQDPLHFAGSSGCFREGDRIYNLRNPDYSTKTEYDINLRLPFLAYYDLEERIMVIEEPLRDASSLASPNN